MIKNVLRRLAIVLCLSSAVIGAALAKDEASVAALLATAERAMTDGDYTAGVAGYVRAAAVTDSLEGARQATLVAYEFGFDESAIEAARYWQALSAQPDDAQLYAALAEVRRGDTRAAVKVLTGIFKRAEPRSAVCESFSDRLSGGARADDLAAVFAQLAKTFDDEPCVVRMAASAAIAIDADDDAEQGLKRLRKLDAFDNDARLLDMLRLVRQDEADTAFTSAELRLDAEATIQQRIELAFINAQAEQRDNALNMLSQMRVESPDDAEVLKAQALLLLQDGDMDASREAFVELLTSGQNTPEALYYLARFAERERRADQALRLYSQVDHGDLVVAAQQRVAALMLQRDGVPAAIDYLEGFTERHPRYGLALSTLRASIYADGKFYDQALALYDDYLGVRANAEFALLARADVLLRADRLDEAISAFRSVVKRYPESANALNALGYTLADRTRKFREAERLIDKALEKEPDNAAIMDSKGWVLFRRGKYEAAREYLEQAWEDFADPEVAAHLGETLWRLGEEDKARKFLQEAWQRFPNDERLRDTVRRLVEDGPATRS